MTEKFIGLLEEELGGDEKEAAEAYEALVFTLRQNPKTERYVKEIIPESEDSNLPPAPAVDSNQEHLVSQNPIRVEIADEFFMGAAKDREMLVRAVRSAQEQADISIVTRREASAIVRSINRYDDK